MAWDVFISHASEDKDEVARPLANLLRKNGVRVWFDEQEIGLGDSLRAKIDEGLAQSTWVVVILSAKFFEKRWAQGELDALVSREFDGQRVILPIWHRISADDLLSKSPLLAARLAISTAQGLDAVCQAILVTVHKEHRQYLHLKKPPNNINDWWFSASSSSTSQNSCIGLMGVDEKLADKENWANQIISQYRLKRIIGQGGSGVVFEATHLLLGRTVALKLFYPLDSKTEEVTRATQRAIRGLSILNHPGIVRLIDFGHVARHGVISLFLVYELIDGCELTKWSTGINESKTAEQQRLRVAIAITEALVAAHNCRFQSEHGFYEIGVLHGDIKPQNIMVRRSDGHPLLIDFMMPDIQKMLHNQKSAGCEWAKNGPGTYRWLRSNWTWAFGTPGYMAPEQDVDGIVTPTTDIYSLGRTFFGLFWPDKKELYNDHAYNRAAFFMHIDSSARALAGLAAEMSSPEAASRPRNMKQILKRLRKIEMSAFSISKNTLQ
jgi:serine/threonine protein kinase